MPAMSQVINRPLGNNPDNDGQSKELLTICRDNYKQLARSENDIKSAGWDKLQDQNLSPGPGVDNGGRRFSKR